MIVISITESIHYKVCVLSHNTRIVHQTGIVVHFVVVDDDDDVIIRQVIENVKDVTPYIAPHKNNIFLIGLWYDPASISATV